VLAWPLRFRQDVEADHLVRQVLNKSVMIARFDQIAALTNLCDYLEIGERSQQSHDRRRRGYEKCLVRVHERTLAVKTKVGNGS
jgi:hypothetical protein